MKEFIVDKDDFVENIWDGGVTTQLFIYPEGTSLKERNFDFRISSASFNSTSSTFSNFTGYNRFILPLKGQINLKHLSHYDISLTPYVLEHFPGCWTTTSTNSLDAIDFNFIVKSDKCSDLEVLAAGDDHTSIDPKFIMIFSVDDFEFTIDQLYHKVEGGKLYVLENENSTVEINILSGDNVIVMEFS